MARLLVVHHDKPTAEFLKVLAVGHCVEVVRDGNAAMRSMVASPPECILVGQDAQQDTAVKLLRWMRHNVLDIPVVVVLGRGGMAFRPAVLKLGAAGVVEMPIDRQRLQNQITAALNASRQAAAGPPPISDEELNSNLSMLETSLNRRMKCVAGQNQVFIQSTVLDSTTTRPRICLKCPLRAEYGQPREVYYTFIRDVCCGDPDRCEASRRFRATREIA